MKNSILTFLLLLSTNAFADVKIVLEGKEYGCDKKSDEIFHCESSDRKILVTKMYMGFTAYEKKGDDLPTMKWLSKVSDGIKILYEVPKFPGMGTSEVVKTQNSQGGYSSPLGGGMFGGMMGGFTPPDSKSLKLTTAKGVAGNLKNVDDEWAREFADQSNKFIEAEKATKSKAKVVLNGKQFSCNRGEDNPLTKEEEQAQALYNMKIQCEYYACTSASGEKVIGYIPAPGSFMQPYLLNVKGTESLMQYNDFKIYDNEKGSGIPLYDIPKPEVNYGGGYGAYGYPGATMEFDENILVPSKFDKNKDTFSFLTDPYSSGIRDEALRRCSDSNDVGKLISEHKKTEELFKNELLTMELGHYITMVNGQMIAMVVDATKGRGLGCLYDDMILSQKAREHLEYLQKAKPKPVNKFISEDEVQDLFKKAKSMDDIPFGYAYDGCYARAHVMARRFEAMGIPTEKAWIKGSLFIPGTDIQWNYHVAPVINVKTKSGEIVKYVIDPSINDKAVPVDGWVATMGKNVKGGVVKTSYPFPVNIASYQRTAVAISSSDIYVPDNDEKRSEEENMAMAVQTMKEYSAALKSNGKGF